MHGCVDMVNFFTAAEVAPDLGLLVRVAPKDPTQRVGVLRHPRRVNGLGILLPGVHGILQSVAHPTGHTLQKGNGGDQVVCKGRACSGCPALAWMVPLIL